MIYEDIAEFHNKFDLPAPIAPALLESELYSFRVRFMREELDEFQDAHDNKDLVKAADALADMMYVVLGTAHMMGLPMDPIWAAVHKANMTKVRATEKSASRRGSTFDVVKPEGFVSPENQIREILQHNGWVE